MKSRLVMAVVSSVLEEVALAFGVLWGLPRLGVEIPLGALIGMMLGLGAWNVFSWRIGIRALGRKPLGGLENMIGSRGKAVDRLRPEGLVQIRGELWQATAAGGEINPGEEITVVGQSGLKLIVSKVGLEGGE